MRSSGLGSTLGLASQLGVGGVQCVEVQVAVCRRPPTTTPHHPIQTHSKFRTILPTLTTFCYQNSQVSNDLPWESPLLRWSRAGRLSALSFPHSDPVFVWHFCMGAQGA